MSTKHGVCKSFFLFILMQWSPYHLQWPLNLSISYLGSTQSISPISFYEPEQSLLRPGVLGLILGDCPKNAP